MDTILIIAQSGQMLARSAANMGLKVYVIDCFSDQDTQLFSTQIFQVASLAIKDIAPTINKIKSYCTYCIYGSGFEIFPESLDFLAHHFQVLGNSSQVFNALQNKPLFFQCLQQLNIPHPAVFFTPPSNKKNYLIKPFNSLGGENIHPLHTLKNTPPVNALNYYQQYLTGETLSVLFIANGRQAQVIGYNRQWSCHKSFSFLRIATYPDLIAQHRQTIRAWLNPLTTSYSLIGVCSLDFIVHQNQCYMLEVNPRPSASMVLYQKDLLRHHISACQKAPQPTAFSPPKNNQAYQIIYAPRQLSIPKNVQWADCYRDLPPAGRIIPQNHPICSMIMSGNNLKNLLKALQAKQKSLFKQLTLKPGLNTAQALIS